MLNALPFEALAHRHLPPQIRGSQEFVFFVFGGGRSPDEGVAFEKKARNYITEQHTFIRKGSVLTHILDNWETSVSDLFFFFPFFLLIFALL